MLAKRPLLLISSNSTLLTIILWLPNLVRDELFVSACTLKKVEKHHGVHFLNKKQEKLTVNKSNKNDILQLLGSPSTKSTFDNDLWIYIERKTDNSSLLTFGNEKIIINNVLLLELDNKGMLKKKRNEVRKKSIYQKMCLGL